jgi:Sec-independent protein translocase protein TatA
VSDILVVLVIVLVAVLMLRGPKMLPRLGEALGRGIKETRQG